VVGGTGGRSRGGYPPLPPEVEEGIYESAESHHHHHHLHPHTPDSERYNLTPNYNKVVYLKYISHDRFDKIYLNTYKHYRYK
jgi:hypothetical protein